MKEFSIRKTLNEMSNLKEAFIDASSLIYLQKIKLLDMTSGNIKLHTIKEVIDEIGFLPLNIDIINVSEKGIFSTDELLIKACDIYKISIISDDYGILKKMKKTGLPFFNSAIIVCFLFFKQKINEREFFYFLGKLKEISYYSDFVWEYVKKLYLEMGIG